MMQRFKFIVMGSTILLLAAGAFYIKSKPPEVMKARLPVLVTVPASTAHLKKLHTKAATLAAWCRRNNLNAEHCFLMDMSLPSGSNRFFVYNLRKQLIEAEALVTHGNGSETGNEALVFSNVPGSNCTSLGKYKVGNAYMGRFGQAYKLHGLSATNNKAFERFVVLHGHTCVPNSEVFPQQICLSQGCPTVSPEFLKTLGNYISKSARPVLLEIYN